MKIYAVIIEKYEDERCSIVTLHRTRVGAEKAVSEYQNNCIDNNCPEFNYYIKEINLDTNKDIIFDSVEEEKIHFNE